MGFWEGLDPRRLPRIFRSLLALEGNPQMKAKAFAIGVFIAFTPTYGLHTITVILASWAFRLPFSILLLGSLVNNPWTFIPIYGSSYMVGRWLISLFPKFYSPLPFHVLAQQLKAFSWKDWLTQAPILIFKEGLPLVVGSLFLGVVMALGTYFVILKILKTREAKKGSNYEGNPKRSDRGLL